MAAKDPYPLKIDDLGSARFGVAVTPSDTVDLPQVTRSIVVATEGLVVVNYSGGGAAVPVYMTAGVQHARAVSRILATGTTATGIVAEW